MASNSGFGLLAFLIGLCICIFIGQMFVLTEQQRSYENQMRTQNAESQVFLINSLADLLIDELSLRNSRFSTNSALYQCLMANPSPCDEKLSYDMVLYAPNPPVIYKGGSWPAPPDGISILAGGLETNKVLYTRSAGHCPDKDLTTPNNLCPAQAVIQFTPLCGGSPAIPDFQSTKATCPGKANGVQITLQVGLYKNGNLVFTNNTTNSNGNRIFRIKANSFMN